MDVPTVHMTLNFRPFNSEWMNTSSHLGIRLIMIICFISSLSNLLAQSSPHPVFKQYTSDNGLPSSEVYDIIQDNQGFIWISTDNGVSRFDGYEFHNFGPREGLKENVIFKMQLDSLGRVWMQANNGKLFYAYQDSIHPYKNNAVLLEYPDRPDYAKGFILEGNGETVHVSTLKYGVISIMQNGESDTYFRDSIPNRQIFSKNDQTIYAQADLSNTNSENQRHIFNTSGKEIIKLHFVDNCSNDSPITIFSPTNSTHKTLRVISLSGKMLLIQFNNSLWYIYDKKIQWHRNYSDIILDGLILPDGRIILGLGMHRGVQIYHSLNDIRYGTGKRWLPGKTVSDIFVDNEESLWLATNEHGIFYCQNGSPLIDDLETGLPDEVITSIAIKESNKIYAGLNNGQIIQLNNNTIYAPIAKLPSSQRIRDMLFEHSMDQLWIGGDYLYLLRNESLSIQNFTYDNIQYSMGNRITMSQSNNFKWICSYAGFIGLDHQGSPKFVLPGFSGRAYIVREDHNGRVWVGKSGGLFEWQDNHLIDRTKLHPAFSLRVEDIEIMPDSTLAIATKGGGVILWKGNEFEQLGTNNGLTTNMIECLHADTHGNLWVGTLNGLNQISGPWENRKVYQITKFNGLPSNEINRIASSSNIVWVATNKGLAHFSSTRPIHTDSPKPIITSIQANGQSVKIAQEVNLGWEENNVTGSAPYNSDNKLRGLLITSMWPIFAPARVDRRRSLDRSRCSIV